jgi:hypothetical protein
MSTELSLLRAEVTYEKDGGVEAAIELAKAYVRAGRRIENHEVLRSFPLEAVRQMPDDALPTVEWMLDETFSYRHPNNHSQKIRLHRSFKTHTSIRELILLFERLIGDWGYEVWRSLAGHLWLRVEREVTEEERLKVSTAYLENNGYRLPELPHGALDDPYLWRSDWMKVKEHDVRLTVWAWLGMDGFIPAPDWVPPHKRREARS